MRPFLLLLPLLLLLLFRGASAQSCPSMPASLAALGYDEHGGKFYRLYRWGDVKKHADAAKICHDAGARLAMFKTQAEFNVVRQYKSESCSMFGWEYVRIQNFCYASIRLLPPV